MPLGIKSITPIRRQPARGRLNTPVGVALRMIPIVSGQSVGHHAEIFEEHDNDDHWADPRALGSGRSLAGDRNDNDKGK
jgi:hypothetical protein